MLRLSRPSSLQLLHKQIVKTIVTARYLSAPAVDAQPATQPELKHVPSLPVFGSFFRPYSGIPKLDWDDFTNFWRELHRENGPFYTVGIPG